MRKLRNELESTRALLRESQNAQLRSELEAKCKSEVMTDRAVQTIPAEIAGEGVPVFPVHNSPLLTRKKTARPAARPFLQSDYRGVKRRRVVGAGGQGRGESRPERCFVYGESRDNLYQHFRKVHKELPKKNFARHYSQCVVSYNFQYVVFLTHFLP